MLECMNAIMPARMIRSGGRECWEGKKMSMGIGHRALVIGKSKICHLSSEMSLKVSVFPDFLFLIRYSHFKLKQKATSLR